MSWYLSISNFTITQYADFSPTTSELWEAVNEKKIFSN